MTFTTISNNKSNLPDGTYRLTKGSVTSPATIVENAVKVLTKGVLFDGKTQYKKL